MIQWINGNAYCWFITHVECSPRQGNFIRYQLIENMEGCDFNKYDCAIPVKP